MSKECLWMILKRKIEGLVWGCLGEPEFGSPVNREENCLVKENIIIPGLWVERFWFFVDTMVMEKKVHSHGWCSQIKKFPDRWNGPDHPIKGWSRTMIGDPPEIHDTWICGNRIPTETEATPNSFAALLNCHPSIVGGSKIGWNYVQHLTLPHLGLSNSPSPLPPCPS